MKEVSFNLNHYVKVKLTERGVNILRKNYNKLPHELTEKYPFQIKLTGDGYYKNQMWQIMQDFGEYIGMGMDTPFETEIILCVEEGR